MMKQRITAFLLAVILILQIVGAYAEGWQVLTSESVSAGSAMLDASDIHLVEFVADEATLATRLVKDEAAIGSLPSAPESDDEEFIGWYNDEEPVTESTPVNSNMKLNAVYSSVDTALMEAKSSANFNYEDKSEYAKVSVFGQASVAAMPSVSADVAVADAVSSREVLAAYTADIPADSVDLMTETVITALPTDGVIAVYELKEDNTLGERLESDYNIGDRVSFALDSAKKKSAVKGVALVREDISEANQAANDSNQNLLSVRGFMPASAIVEATPVRGLEIEGQETIAAYDIKIYNNEAQREKDKTWQPLSSVTVRLYAGTEQKNKPVQVYHLPDAYSAADAQLVQTVTVGANGWVEFEAESFSVYAITDGEGSVVTPRAIYTFCDDSGTALEGVETQIIKNLETLTSVTPPTYDNKAFLGWYIFENGVRGEEVVFDSPITVMFGSAKALYGNSIVVPHVDDNDTTDHVDVQVRAVYTTSFATVYYLTDYDTPSTNYQSTVVVKDSVKVPMPSGSTSTTYTIPDKDAISVDTSKPDYTFVGWSTTAPSRTNNKYNYYSDSDNRTTITELPVVQSRQYVLYPVFKKANWINFKTAPTGSGADYISPAYVVNGQRASTKKPTDPTWRGHKFLYWTTTPTFDEETGEMIEFDTPPEEYHFDQTLSEDVTLYAYWESGYTTYTVIHWKQKVTDDKNVDPADRSYDFEEQEIIEAKVGTVITADDITPNEYEGFHHRTDENQDTGNVTVVSSGSSIYNVYYDRDLITMKFYNGNGEPTGGYDASVYTTEPSPVYSSTNDNDGTQYAKIGNDYVELTKSVTTVNTYNWRYTDSNVRNYYIDSGYTDNIFYTVTGNSYTTSGYTTSNPPPENDVTVYYCYDKYDRRYYQLNRVIQGTTETYIWYLNGEEYTGTRYQQTNNGFWYTGLYGQTLEQNGYSWPIAEWQYYTNDDDNYHKGMSFLGQFVLPDDTKDTTHTEIRFYSQTPEDNKHTVEFYLENLDGYTYTLDTTVEFSGNLSFYFSNKYDGFNVSQYRRYTGSGNNRTYVEEWQDITDSNGSYGSVDLYDGYVYMWNYIVTKNYNLEVRYARKKYNIFYLDPMDNSALTVQLKNGNTVQKQEDVNYQADITNYYPAADFEPVSRQTGYSFNGRWFADQGQTTQIFFHTSGNAALTADEEKNLWYYVDTSGEKIYTGYVPTAEQQAMSFEKGDSREYHQDEVLVYTEMPMHDVPVYAGYSKDWYWIKIDPAGGELPLDGSMSTYFWEAYGGLVQEYHITRLYLEDGSGDYYYHYAEFNEADPDGAQYSTRRAWYSTESGEENGVPSNGKRYKLVSDAEGYEFAGWYEVLEDGSLAPYNFDTIVTHNLILRAVWKQKGNYQVYYSTAKALDVNGNEITDLSVANGAIAPVDNFKYAADANIVVLSEKVESSDPDEYLFAGWYFDNKVLNAGDVFTGSADLAEVHPEAEEGAKDKDTFVLYPVYVKKGEIIDPDRERTALILDANGGSAVEGLSNRLPTGSTLNDDGTQLSIEWDDKQINASIDLPNYDIYEKEDEDFLGWAFSKDAKTPVFVKGQKVGVDNLQGSGYNGDGTNTLYAVWRKTKITVTIKKIVTGNMGDRSKAFTFTYQIDGGTEQEFTLTHGNQNAITKVPVGVTFTITESDNNGYEVSAVGKYDENEELELTHTDGTYTYSFTVPDEDTEITYTNNNEQPVDTGVTLAALPYHLILTLTTLGLFLLLTTGKKRRRGA